MAPNAQNGRIGPRHRVVLKLLAEAPVGRADPMFLARFTIELLDLVHDGLATARRETMRVGKRKIKVARIRITGAGRRALEG